MYGADYHLPKGEQVLAGLREEGAYGCIAVDDREYEIAHPGRTGWGWHFRLIDRENGEDV